jgi:hypothetical protein
LVTHIATTKLAAIPFRRRCQLVSLIFLVFLFLGAFVLPVPGHAVAQQAACFPACRDGYLCSQARCIEACNPPCGPGQRCTGTGTCTTLEAVAPKARLGSGYAGVAFGPAIGNAYGGVLQLEFGGGSEGHYFAGIIHALSGANFSGNRILMPGLGLGYRGVFGTGDTRFTMFVGPMALYTAEIEGNTTYHYTTVWGRVQLGFMRPSWWGVEAGIGMGYQHHWHERGETDYGGFSGTFDVRWRRVW